MNIKSTSLHAMLIAIFFFSTQMVCADNPQAKNISVLPTIKPPSLVHVNTEVRAQYKVQNLSNKNVRLIFMKQKGVKQDTSGLLSCSHPFSLQPGEKCLLNLIISGNKVGQKIIHGPLVCQANASGQINPKTSFCTQPTKRDRLNVRITKPKLAIIEVKPQSLTLHAASRSPDKLTIINHSQHIIAKNIAAKLPADWTDVKQHTNDCKFLKPGHTCTLYFNAKKAHPSVTGVVSGTNTIRVPVKFLVLPHEIELLGPANH